MRLFAKDKNGHFIREVNGIKLPFPLTEFMKVRFVGYAFSAILMAISLFFIVTKGFNWGLDFTGGVVFDTHFSQPADLEKIRGTLNQNGIASPIVQTTGSVQDVMIRLPADNNDSAIGDHVKACSKQLTLIFILTVSNSSVQTLVKNWLKVRFMRPLQP